MEDIKGRTPYNMSILSQLFKTGRGRQETFLSWKRKGKRTPCKRIKHGKRQMKGRRLPLPSMEMELNCRIQNKEHTPSPPPSLFIPGTRWDRAEKGQGRMEKEGLLGEEREKLLYTT